MTDNGSVGPTQIPDWPDYAATRDGRIWSVGTDWRGYGKRELRPIIHRGYPTVRLSLGEGKRKRIFVHKLIARTFIGECPEGCDQIRHLDGNPTNNSVANLAWGNAADNAADRKAHGREVVPTPKLRAALQKAGLSAGEGC